MKFVEMRKNPVPEKRGKMESFIVRRTAVDMSAQ